MSTRYVVVGGVAGGATAAARLRRLDETAQITLIERGPYVSYANCGLPYFIGGDIQKRSKLLLQTPEGFYSRYRIEALLETEVIDIDRDQKTLKVRDPAGERKLPYDKVILAQGGSPIIPKLPGTDQNHVFKLWTVPDMDRIHRFITEHKAQKALIAGAGFIGLEMAEALKQRGLETRIVEFAPHILPVLDQEFAQAAQNALEAKGVIIHTGCALQEIREKEVVFSDGSVYEADLVLLSVGVRPNIELAKKIGLEIGETGGLLVNEYLQTSDPFIFAAGDMLEIVNKVSGKKARIPLAGPANRQGRLAADNASGRKSPYNGALGSSVVKLFDYTAASCGLSEESAEKLGIPALSVTVHKDNHASYYPGGSELSLKLVFDPESHRLLGAQAFGQAGVEKRIDVLAMALEGELTLEDLAEVDLAYAPPYSSANDPINQAAFVALNRLSGDSPALSAQEFKLQYKAENDLVLDVRTLGERTRRQVVGSIHIPVDDLRDRLEELPKDKQLWVHCESGYRSHLAVRILKQSGFSKVTNISGGMISLERSGLPLDGTAVGKAI